MRQPFPSRLKADESPAPRTNSTEWRIVDREGKEEQLQGDEVCAQRKWGWEKNKGKQEEGYVYETIIETSLKKSGEAKHSRQNREAVQADSIRSILKIRNFNILSARTFILQPEVPSRFNSPA